MVDNFLSAGTQGDDEESPSPYGTGPANRATEEHRRSDYDNDTWRDRGLDPAPSLPNAPRTYERGPVPQQPYVPKPPYLPSAPPPSQQPPRVEQSERVDRREYYGESREDSYGREHQEQNPFRPQQPPQASPQGRPSPFGPGSGSSGGSGAAQPRPAQPPVPPSPTPQAQGGSGTPQRPPQASNGSTNWSSPAPQPSPFVPQPPAANNGTSNGLSNGLSSHGSSNGLSNGLGSQQPPRPPQRLQPPDAPRAQEPGRGQEPPRRYEPGPGPEPVWGHDRIPEPTRAPETTRPAEPLRSPEPDEARRQEEAVRQEPPRQLEDTQRREDAERRLEALRRQDAEQREAARRREEARQRAEAERRQGGEETRPQEIRLRSGGQSQEAAPGVRSGYLSDPSAEYESTDEPAGTPAGEQPHVPGAARPLGARRRADVQQDAPSQVSPEQATSHRAGRRAQPIQDSAVSAGAAAGKVSAGSGAGASASGASAAGSPVVASVAPGGEAEVSPYGGGAGKQSAEGAAAGNGVKRPRRYRIHHLRDFKSRGEKWAMLTAYDQYTAEIFDQAGIPVLLVGDSAANNVFGYDTTLRVTVDELIPLARAVAGAVEHSLVVADLPFGSYQASPEQAFHTAVRFMKEAGVHAVKLEGGRTVVPMVEKLTQSGIPVMAHIGFTPQSEHSIGGYRVQGRGDQAAGLIDDAVALAEAGAFSVVLEMVPGDVAAEITKRIPIPTIGIGAGRDTDAQVLVWQDMAGLRSGTMPRFVKQYADLRGILTNAATTYASEVASGAFPGDEHTF
ncbi:3-methyl-2-oxobutanoate hydroxymethyltransferase [Kribbella sp. VKM Ac-2566]|uniref:3-methyl-2-oxobutanoate hydroxymethyltransferase n=1 Tax=Kribbella sp. VKM Ac-2566 TaxID=2512218 RepID=UPI00351930B0